MTSATIAAHTHSPSRRCIQTDLAFWSGAGLLVAAASGPLSVAWNAPRAALVCVGVAFAVLGPPMLFGLNRLRPTRALIASFAVTNAALVPLAWGAAALGWLSLSDSGNAALAGAGLVMLVFAAWQAGVLRRAAG